MQLVWHLSGEHLSGQRIRSCPSTCLDELGKHPQWEDNGPTTHSKYGVCGKALLSLNSAFLNIKQYNRCGAGKHKRLTEQNNP